MNSDYQLPIIIESKIKFNKKNYNNIKKHVTNLLIKRLNHFRIYGVMCPLLKKYIKTKDLLDFFCITMSKDKKVIKIDYKEDKYESIPCSAIIRSIDYGTFMTPPKRIFYPIFRYIRKNFAKYLN